MAEKPNSGFVIPDPNQPGAQPPQPPQPTTSANTVGVKDLADGLGLAAVPEGPQPRDYAIGGGVLLVLLVAFFFAKNAYANHLARRRVPPGAANAAGWWLFILLACLATAPVLAVINPVKFLSSLFMAPLGAVSLVALVLMIMSGRRS